MDRIFEVTETILRDGVELTPGWWFWDETDAGAVGPYDSRQEADKAMEEYGKHLNLPNHA